MDKQQLINEVEDLVGASKAEQAIDLLLDFLDKEGAYKDLKAYAIQISAAFEKNSRDERLNYITADTANANYSKINAKILDLVDHIRRDDLTWKPEQPPTAKTNRSLTWILSSVLGLLVIITGVLLYGGFGNDNEAGVSPAVEDQEIEICPDFEKYGPDAFNILLFPFQPLGAQFSSTHSAISQRFGTLAEDYDINLGIDFYKGGKLELNEYPKSTRDALGKAEPCKANLLIWGTEEVQPGKTIVRTQYRFLDLNDNFSFKEIQLLEDTEIDTISSFSNIINGQELLTDSVALINTVKLLFGIVAHEQAKDDVAMGVLNDIDSKDSTNILLREMTLADIYISKNQPEQAIEAYTKVLETHPDYWLARKNRGMLHYQNGKYQESIEDLTAELENRPQDTAALLTRSSAYIKTKELEKAKKDLNTIQKIAPENKMLPKKLQEWKKTERAVIRERNALQVQVEENPNDVKVLTNIAQVNRNLGDYNSALQTATIAIQKDPSSLDGYVAKIETLIDQGKTKEAKEAFDAALNSRINRDKLIEASSAIKNLIEPSTMIFRKGN